MEFDVKSRSKQCSVTGRDLEPGDTVYSCLITNEQGEVVRRDYASENWNEPPENAVGWWKVKIPERDPNKIYWAPKQVILNYFLEMDPEKKKDVRYVLALLMIRRKIFRLEEIETIEKVAGDDTSETEKTATENLVLTSIRDKQEHIVPVASIDENQIQQIENELVALLFSHEPPQVDIDCEMPADDSET